MKNVDCTCGSGAHPRKCEKHPHDFDLHCSWLDLLTCVDECELTDEADIDDFQRTSNEVVMKYEAASAKSRKHLARQAKVEAYNDIKNVCDNVLKVLKDKFDKGQCASYKEQVAKYEGAKKLSEAIALAIQTEQSIADSTEKE